MQPHRQFSRRAVLAGAMTAGAAALTAGCGGKSSGSAGTATKGELQVWGGVPAETGPNQMFAAFNKKYPNIKVTYTRYVNDPPGNLKVDTALSGNVGIDVLVSYGANDITKRATSGLFIDITDRISSDSAFKKYQPGANSFNYIYDGKAYTIPAAATPTVVMLNQDMLTKKGITIPDNWTTDDFKNIAQQLSGPGVFGTFNTQNIARDVLGSNYYYKDGGKSSNFANPLFADTLQYQLDLISAKAAMPESSIISQDLSVYPQTVFLTGKVGMLLNEVYISRYINDTKTYPHTFKTVMKPVPKPTVGGTPVGGSYWNEGAYGDFLSITKTCKNPDAAWTLIDWWMKDGAAYMVAGGRLPSQPGVSVDQMVPLLLGSKPDSLYDVDSVKSSVWAKDIKIPLDTITTGAAEIATDLTALNEECLLGKITTAQWTTQAVQKCDADIKKDS